MPQVHIVPNYPKYEVQVFFEVEVGPHGSGRNFVSIKDGKTYFQKVEESLAENVEVSPFITLPIDLWQKFAPLFIGELDKLGVKTPDVSSIEGKLVATEKHLSEVSGNFRFLLEAYTKQNLKKW